MPGAGQQAAITTVLSNELTKSVAANKFLDTPFSVVYATVVQEGMQDVTANEVDVKVLFSPHAGQPVMPMLDQVAKVREG